MFVARISPIGSVAAVMIDNCFVLMRGLAVTAIAVALCSLGAAAQESPASTDAINAMIGNWEFSNADRDKLCRFVFRSDATTGGYKLDVDKNCANLFPSTKDVAGWTLDSFGTLRLLDKAGNSLIELSEAETGIFDGFQPGEGRYVLQIATTSRRLGHRARYRQAGLLLDACQQSGGSRQPSAQSQAGLRPIRRPLQSGFLARRPRRTCFGFGSRPDVALRRRRSKHLDARAGKH
jgi:hypothetical protein